MRWCPTCSTLGVSTATRGSPTRTMCHRSVARSAIECITHAPAAWPYLKCVLRHQHVETIVAIPTWHGHRHERGEQLSPTAAGVKPIQGQHGHKSAGPAPEIYRAVASPHLPKRNVGLDVGRSRRAPPSEGQSQTEHAPDSQGQSQTEHAPGSEGESLTEHAPGSAEDHAPDSIHTVSVAAHV